MGALLVVLLLTLVNGVLSGAEIAVLSVRKTRLAELRERGRRGAAAVLWLRHQPERFLATVQVGLTLVSTTAAAFGGEELAQRLATRLRAVPWLAAWAPPVALVLVILAIAYLNIVLGELIPKSLALRSAETYALLLGPVLRRLATLLRPVVWLLTASSNLLLRIVDDRTSFTETRLSPEELQELVEEAARVGSLDGNISEIASRTLAFRELRAADVQVPRGSLASLPLDAPTARVLALLSARPFRRVPVYDGAEENFVGYVATHELLLRMASSPADTSERAAPLLVSVLRPLRFVHGRTLAVELLRTLQSERSPLALVVDDEGAVTGLVTAEDLVEELVGEIVSEHEAVPVEVRWDEHGVAIVAAQTPLRDVNRALRIELPEPEGFTTLGGLCLHLAGRIPAVGDRFETPDGSVLEVLEVAARRVRTVRLQRPAPRPRDSLDAL